MSYDGGVKNSVVDFIKVNRKNNTIVEYGIAHDAETLAPLGTPTEIKYERIEQGRYKLYVYKYSKCQYTVFSLSGGWNVSPIPHISTTTK